LIYINNPGCVLLAVLKYDPPLPPPRRGIISLLFVIPLLGGVSSQSSKTNRFYIPELELSNLLQFNLKRQTKKVQISFNFYILNKLLRGATHLIPSPAH
jgi:hypothetical protein